MRSYFWQHHLRLLPGFSYVARPNRTLSCCLLSSLLPLPWLLLLLPLQRLSSPVVLLLLPKPGLAPFLLPLLLPLRLPLRLLKLQRGLLLLLRLLKGLLLPQRRLLLLLQMLRMLSLLLLRLLKMLLQMLWHLQRSAAEPRRHPPCRQPLAITKPLLWLHRAMANTCTFVCVRPLVCVTPAATTPCHSLCAGRVGRCGMM